MRKRLEQHLYEKMYKIQDITMESKALFIISQLLALIVRELFLAFLFVSPLEELKYFRVMIFEEIQNWGIAITILMFCWQASIGVLMCLSEQSLSRRNGTIISIFLYFSEIFVLPSIVVAIYLIQSNLKVNISISIANLALVIVIPIFSIIYNQFNFTKQLKSKNLFHKNEAKMVINCNILTLIFAYFITIKYFLGNPLANGETIIYSLIFSVISCLQFKDKALKQYFLNSFSQQISIFFFSIELNHNILILINYLSGNILYNSLSFLMILTTILAYSAINAYIVNRDNLMLLSEAAQLKNEDDAGLYLHCLSEISRKVESEQDDMMIVGLQKQHMMSCNIPNCFCNEKSITLRRFFLKYIKCELEQMQQIFHQSQSVLISILYFKIILCKEYPQILATLNYYTNHFTFNYKQRYYKYCLSRIVKDYIGKKNVEIKALSSETIFLFEKMKIEIILLIKSEIEVKTKKWKELALSMCRISMIYDDTKKQLNNYSKLTSIFNENKIIFKKSKEFNLLLLFYFTKVSFVNLHKELRNNINQIYAGYKDQELFQLKEFKKFIFHKNGCALETLVDYGKIGVITNVSKSVQSIFGYSPSEILGQSINTAMPHVMGEEHEIILQNWVKTGTWKTIGKLKEIYCIHKQKFCFSAILYLKLYVRDNSLYFITNVFKLNENDYLIVSPNMKIEGLGKKFVKLFGESAKNLDIQLLMENEQGFFSNEQYLQGKIYRKTFYNLQNAKEKVQEYHEQRSKITQADKLVELNKRIKAQIASSSTMKYLTEFEVKKMYMGSIFFIVIYLRESKRLETGFKVDFSNSHSWLSIVQNTEKELKQSEHSLKSSTNYGDKKNQMIENGQSSITTSGEKDNYLLSKTIAQFINFVEKPSIITDSRLQIFNIFLVIFLLCLVGVIFTSYFAYIQLLYEIQDIFLADGAVSDVMQTTQFGYGSAYEIQSILATNKTDYDFKSAVYSARYLHNYVYQLRTHDFEFLIKATAKISSNRLYEYLQKETRWKMKGKIIPMQTVQFLQNIYYLSKKITTNLQQNKRLNKTQIDYRYQELIKDNFNELQHLNEYFLVLYGILSEDTHILLNKVIILSMLLFFVISALIGFIFNRYYKFKFDQIINIYNAYKFIPIRNINDVKDYYTQLSTRIITKNKLKNMNELEQDIIDIQDMNLLKKDEDDKILVSRKLKLVSYQSYMKWIVIVVVVLALNGINYAATSQIIAFFPSSRDAINKVNELMRTENNLIQAYFEIKQAYYINRTKFINKQLYEELTNKIFKIKNNFHKNSYELITIFQKYDQNYKENFIKVLTHDICKFTVADLDDFLNQKCEKDLALKMLNNGILISMDFFQITVREAIEDLHQQYVTKKQSIKGGDYFDKQQYWDLDKMMIYMFKIYQATQAASYNSYKNTIEVITPLYLKINIAVILIVVLVVLFWIKEISNEKIKLAILYGQLLLIPFAILKANPRVVNHIKETIEYQQI